MLQQRRRRGLTARTSVRTQHDAMGGLAMKTLKPAAAAGAGLAAATPAAASSPNRTLGAIAADFGGQLGQIASMISILAFVLGVCVAIAGLLKFRQHAQNPGDPSAKPTTALMLILAGAALVAIPATLGSGVATIFGNGAETTTSQGGFGRF